MEEQRILSLKRELKLKKFQFNSIYEFSSSLYSSFEIDNIVRVFFSTLMGQMGVSRIFLYDSLNRVFKRRGFKLAAEEWNHLKKHLKKLNQEKFYIKTDELPDEYAALKESLLNKKIHYLVNMSESSKRKVVLGLGYKFNRIQLTVEDIEFSFFITRFALIAIDNAFMVNKMIEAKQMETEMKIAKDIQQSLLPREIPQFKHFEIAVVYEPLKEVGGDYYDILKIHRGMVPVLIVDVEGKGVSAALVGASSQAIFHSLNEYFWAESDKLMAKANSLIYDLAKGNRFVTLFLMVVDDEKPAITYVNAGHVEPILCSGNKIEKLNKGGFLAGFVEDAEYEKTTLSLKKGDVICAFTDGVSEVENSDGEEYGENNISDYIKKNRHLSAEEISSGIYKNIKKFSKGAKFKDDFTLMVLKVK